MTINLMHVIEMHDKKQEALVSRLISRGFQQSCVFNLHKGHFY